MKIDAVFTKDYVKGSKFRQTKSFYYDVKKLLISWDNDKRLILMEWVGDGTRVWVPAENITHMIQSQATQNWKAGPGRGHKKEDNGIVSETGS